MKQSVGLLITLIALAAATTGCGSDNSKTSAAEQSKDSNKETTSESPAPVEPLVGEWQRVQKCTELVRALKKAGLEESAPESVIGSGFLPRVTKVSQLADPADPCRGAKPRVHSHFFTEFGEFGSLDEFGQQVDDGTYKIVNDRTFVLGGHLTFHFQIDGDSIMFDPVLPRDCSKKKRPGDASYMIGVAYPGKSWERVS